MIKSRPDRAQQRAAAFVNLGRRLSAVRTAREAAQIIVDAADALCGWDACRVELCSPTSGPAEILLRIDTVQGQRSELDPVSPVAEPGPSARQALAGGAQLVLRPAGVPLPAEAAPFGDEARAAASLMYVPVRNEAATIGLLSIWSYRHNAYDQEDLATLQALADYCGGALERILAQQDRERLRRELRQRAEAEQAILRVNAELECRVRERTEQVESLNQELEAFSYSVSHDLRAPLRSLRGFSEVLLERCAGKLDPRGQEYLRRACESGRQMEQRVEDLLRLSRVGRAELRCEVVELSALVQQVATELHRADSQRQVEFVIAPNLRAEGDPTLLRVVLENLLRNAWKFTSRCLRARVEFGALAQSPPVFFTRDNGAGFDPAYAGKLFGVFQRLHSASEFPGSGVGLAIVKRIVNRHGGRVWATAAVDQGATFYFTLRGQEKPLTFQAPRPATEQRPAPA